MSGAEPCVNEWMIQAQVTRESFTENVGIELASGDIHCALRSWYRKRVVSTFSPSVQIGDSSYTTRPGVSD